jgi:hypothetical protein
VFSRAPVGEERGWQRGVMNKFERIKAEKDGLDIVKEIPAFAQQGWEAITEADLERLKGSSTLNRGAG